MTLDLSDIVKVSDGQIFNNAGQAWNHNFFWECLTDKPSAINEHQGLSDALQKNFGSFDDFKSQFISSAIGVFGSGWTWLVKDDRDQLLIINTANADTPIREDRHEPLLVCDVWEHAYYIDYRNARNEYLHHFFDFVDWAHSAKIFESKFHSSTVNPSKISVIERQKSTYSP